MTNILSNTLVDNVAIVLQRHQHATTAIVFSNRELFGHNIGKIVWFTALIATWGLSALGFYKIYKSSKI